MNGKQLKNSILQWAIQGKLVPQDPNDEPASVLLEKIRQEKERLIKEKKIKRDKNASIIYRGEDNSYYEKILATGEVKCIDEEVPFEIPQGWEWCRIRHISQSYIGLTYSPSEVSPQGTIVLRSSNIQDGKIVLDDIVRVTKNISEKLRVEKNDIIICARNGSAKLVGKSAIVTEVTEPMTFGAFMAICKTSLYQYVSIFLQSDLFFSQLRGVSGTTTINQLTQSNFNGFLIAIPPLEEQHRIFEKVNDVLPIVEIYGNKQEQLNKLNDNLRENVKKSILQEAIQGKLVPQIAEECTAQKLLEQIKTEKQKLVKEGKLKKSALNDSVIFRGDDNKYYEQIGKKNLDVTEQIPFEIPSNWEWCRVRNVSNSYIGLTYKPTDIDEKGTIVLRSCNIRNGKLALDDIVRVSSSISEKLLIEENDIIICARNGSKRLVGKSALIRNLPEPMTFGAFMAICKTPIYEYMFAYLQSDLFFGQLRDVSNTTTINQLTQNKFNDFLIPIPPIREQERIAFKISQLFQKLR